MSDSFLAASVSLHNNRYLGSPALAAADLGITPVALRAPSVIPKSETAETFLPNYQKTIYTENVTAPMGKFRYPRPLLFLTQLTIENALPTIETTTSAR